MLRVKRVEIESSGFQDLPFDGKRLLEAYEKTYGRKKSGLEVPSDQPCCSFQPRLSEKGADPYIFRVERFTRDSSVIDPEDAKAGRISRETKTREEIMFEILWEGLVGDTGKYDRYKIMVRAECECNRKLATDFFAEYGAKGISTRIGTAFEG